MIRRIVGFALYYGLGVGSAVLAMVLVLPPLKHGSASPTAGGVQHALLVEGANGCPALAGAAGDGRCPYLATAATESRCPYFAAVAAEGRCPYLAAVAASSSCPFLRGGGSEACPYLQAHPEAGGRNVAPRATRPDAADGTQWMPEGTVLALGPAPDGADDEVS